MASRPAASPSEAYAASRYRSAYPGLTEFSDTVSFELDPFQRSACEAIENGHGVLVCAPTGAGKTVVGEFAVHQALAQGLKCFYTTPIKALSNQKYADLVAKYDSSVVGLLTGDTAINGDAPIVVMTTEVLRNMLYAGSTALNGLGYVVMDEVHYLADRFRGAVWEEVILHLPESVRVISLSATVSNAEEFGEWLVAVRGDTTVVVDEHRPVPLWQHMFLGRGLVDLFEDVKKRGQRSELQVNPLLLRRTDEVSRYHSPGGRWRSTDRRPPRTRPVSRIDVITALDAARLLPAIYFIFSRAGCDAAVTQCVRSGHRLTTPEQADAIRAVIDARVKDIPDGDLAVLGYWEWREALERGIASHHAGLLPAFKEVVEELFVRGLVKVVFATETLALGINMPAKTVVLEKLVKYNGEAHVDLTPGEYTQLTGRAGRRGIDVEGHAVVLWQPGIDPKQVAGLASTRTYPLRSSFRPGYNMAVNLVHQLGSTAARTLLEQSFAQFQADRSVVGLARKIDRNKEGLAGYAKAMTCHLGDFAEYAALRAKLSEREKALARRNAASRRAEAAESVKQLARGDVIAMSSGRRTGLAVVLDINTNSFTEPRLIVLTEDRWAGPVSASDFSVPVAPLGRMRLAKHVDWRSPKTRRDLASALRDTGITAEKTKRSSTSHDDAELAALRRAIRAHPCHGCPERETHARWAERYQRLAQETEKLERQVASTTHSLARAFDRITALLTERGYLAKSDRGLDATATGLRLARLYSESDLLVAECLRHGVWQGLGPTELAAVVSGVVFESRRDGQLEPRLPAGAVTKAAADTLRIWAELEEGEQRNRIDQRTRQPDLGFAWPIYRWARGESLEKVLTTAATAGQELSAGDFVRWCRQVIDLLSQIKEVLGMQDPLGKAAADAVTAIRRGIIAMADA